jgi:hypothetical protein
MPVVVGRDSCCQPHHSARQNTPKDARSAVRVTDIKAARGRRQFGLTSQGSSRFASQCALDRASIGMELSQSVATAGRRRVDVPTRATRSIHALRASATHTSQRSRARSTSLIGVTEVIDDDCR